MKHSRFIHASSALVNVASNLYTTWVCSCMFSGEACEMNCLLFAACFRRETSKRSLPHTRQCLFTILRESSVLSPELIVFMYVHVQPGKTRKDLVRNCHLV